MLALTDAEQSMVTPKPVIAPKSVDTQKPVIVSKSVFNEILNSIKKSIKNPPTEAKPSQTTRKTIVTKKETRR